MPSAGDSPVPFSGRRFAFEYSTPLAVHTIVYGALAWRVLFGRANGAPETGAAIARAVLDLGKGLGIAVAWALCGTVSLLLWYRLRRTSAVYLAWLPWVGGTVVVAALSQ